MENRSRSISFTRLLMIAISLAGVAKLDSTEAAMYVDKFNFVIGRKAPSKDAESIIAIPFGTKLFCRPQGSTETIMSMTGQWYYCKEINGYVFGPLLSPSLQSKSKLKMRLKEGFVSDAHGHSGDFFQLLARNKIDFRGMEYLGIAGEQEQIPVKGKGSYTIENHFLIIKRYGEKAGTYRLRWHPKINAFVQEEEFDKVNKILPTMEFEEKRYRINRDLCVIEEVENWDEKIVRVYLGDGYSLYCPQ
ncbi:hypothetical protein [Turneriella parva]|nr:hypothetical protein [Turneriella parva]